MTGKITTREVLEGLAVGGLIISAFLFPALPAAVMSAKKEWQKVNRKDFGRIITRLQKQQMVSIKEVDGKLHIEVTEKGKVRILEYNFANIERKALKVDGKWRLIVFDIPEKKKRSRDAFRKKLLQLECIRLQDSVFVSAFPILNEIDFLCNFLDISDYVSVVLLNKIERGTFLNFQKFNS